MTGTRNLTIGLAICALLLVAVSPAAADTHNVAPGDSIQAAIIAADPGDQIAVAPGTYLEAIDFSGKAIRLYSTGGPGATTINGGGASHVVQCVSGEGPATVLEGFTITGGNARSIPPNDRGAGMYNNGSSPTVTNCVFTGNAAYNGGGMANENSNPAVTDCTFTGNSATAYYGGGMYNYHSSPTVTNCAFANNTADAGGGMSNYPASSPTVTNCTFRNNSARAAGGMQNHENSSPRLTNCTFTGNHATQDNGGMSNHSASDAVLINCVFTGNSAGLTAGGMQNAYSHATLTNCTFLNNTAGVDGGGLRDRGGSNSTVTNCIFWGNTPHEIFILSSTPAVTCSDVQGGWPGAGNIDLDPVFADAGGRLAGGSPCMDAGDNSAVPADITTDRDGNARLVNGTVDMGAYEFQVGPIHNVTRDLWYLTIQSAIDGANHGDQIEVAPGTYSEAINFSGKAIRLYSKDGPDVTTINGAGHYHVVQCVSGEGPGTILEGFTITGGNANGALSPNNHGGGMYNSGARPTVKNCTFTGNSAASFGGGMYNHLSDATVTDCTFSQNQTTDSLLFPGQGAGMYNSSSSPTVSNCTFSENMAVGAFFAPGQGGGLYNYHSSPTLTHCTFTGNTAGYAGSTLGGGEGGGMYNNNGSPTVTDCTFTANSAADAPWPGESTGYGTGMYNNSSSPTVTGCEFKDNVQGSYALYDNSSSPTVDHCLFSGNNSGMQNDVAGSPTVTYCTFSSNTGSGMGNGELTKANVTDCNFTGNGDGMSNSFGASPTVTDCNFTGNTWVGMFNTASGPTVKNCTFSGNQGAGMANMLCGPEVTNCIFTGNGTSATWGGGMLNDAAWPTVTGCTFTNNTVSTYGGGMFNTMGTVAAVTDCTFSGNSAQNGGGMFNSTSWSTVKNCTFTGNTAGNYGGGMGNDACNPNVTNCTFTSNTAGGAGGGMSNFLSGPAVTNCIFTSNKATGSGYGGGMYNGEGNPTVTGCMFAGNSAHNGGGMFNSLAGPKVTNCVFSGNTARHWGGGMGNDLCSPKVLHCTFAGNTASGQGGGMSNFLSNPAVTNCIVWNNAPQSIYDWLSHPPVTYSDVQGGWGGTGNKNINPWFADSARRLARGSPCIDAGSNGAAGGVATDRDGNPRIADGNFDGVNVVDMGAYEYTSAWADADRDGIEDAVDTQPAVYSNDFAQGLTIGAILSRGEQTLIVSDAPDPVGVEIKAAASGGATAARVCISNGTVMTLHAGDDVFVTCGSVEIAVLDGTVEITFVATDGTQAQTILNAGNGIEFEPETFVITAPQTNTEEVVVVVGEETLTLTPGENRMFAWLDIDPDTLNLDNQGTWLTCYLELPLGFDVGAIDVSTVMLNDQVPAQLHPTQVGDYDQDGVADLMVKFDQALAQATLAVGNAVPMTVSGKLTDGTEFEGCDMIRVIAPGGQENKPPAPKGP